MRTYDGRDDLRHDDSVDVASGGYKKSTATVAAGREGEVSD
jgi:hypothetical protein